MCSQSGNIQDLAGYSSHSPSLILESDTEPDSSRQEYANPSSLPSEMGLRYMISTTDDVRFNPDSGTSTSPVYSSESAVQNTTSSSTLAFAPYTNLSHQSSLSGNTFFTGGNPLFSPSFSMPDIKPRLGSHPSSGLAPLSRSPALPHPASPISTRELYTGATPHLRRTSDLIYRSPSAGTIRGVPHSPTSGSGFTSPISNMDTSLGGNGPPLHATEVIYSLQSSDGQPIKPDIMARIDKGFFLADQDWTCYRRNYFSLNCSYTLLPHIPNGPIHLVQHNSTGPTVQNFAMSIAAVVDGRDGKPIELVQHTPKRDKGPQDKPPRINLAPRPPPSHNLYGASDSNAHSLYSSQNFPSSPNSPAMEATFERIQFKNATANNGKRRAAQQYYHLLVELYANVGTSGAEQYVKIATRMSAPMVVRGRSPGHYQSERRGSNTSPGGGGSAGGAGGYSGSGGSSRAGGDISMGGMGGTLGSSGYGSGYDARNHHYRSHIAPLAMTMEPTISAEEAKGIEGMYYQGGTVWEHEESRGGYHLPSLPSYGDRRVKQEYTSGSGYVLPSLDSGMGFARGCGRWEENGRYLPTSMIHSEMNIT